jgi:hypothetical protein
MSWAMLDDDAAALEAAGAKWLKEQFEYEYCADCGGDAIDHVAGYDPFGNTHAYCKPIMPGERVSFEYGTTRVIGTVIQRLGARIQVVADNDAFVTHWITDTDALRYQTS